MIILKVLELELRLLKALLKDVIIETMNTHAIEQCIVGLI